MDTVAQNDPIPYDNEYEPEAADAVAAALVALGTTAHAEYMGFGTPVLVDVSDDSTYLFQGWGDEDGWYASRQYLDDGTPPMWQPDESQESLIELPALAGVTDIGTIAKAIHDAIEARYSA